MLEGEQLTENEIEELANQVEDSVEEYDEYSEYNKMLEGTPYTFGYAGLQRKVKKGATEEKKTLSNFMPLPVKKLYLDNGMESEGWLEIEGVLNNKIGLPKIKVNYNKLETMQWLVRPEWDLYARTFPPKSNHREYIYDVVQMLSIDIPRETIYQHTGFRKINNKWVYLHQNGAIGSKKDVRVDLSEISLERYSFTDKKFDVKESIQKSLSILDLANKEITIPLLSLVYLAPLRTFFVKAGIPLGFVTWIVGESGSQKSSVSALLVSHFGDFERDTLPGGFKDTTNSMEKKAFTLKDTLFPIDDYYPSQTQQEGKRMDAVAESLFGLYGDRQARSRMRQDGKTVKMGFPARGMCIVTGESFPTFAESRTARALIIELLRGDIDLNLLSKSQMNKEELSFCMKEYILYLIENADGIIKASKDKFIKYRNEANEGLSHGRIPEIVATEYMAFEIFLVFAIENGVITEEQKKELAKTAWKYLKEAGRLYPGEKNRNTTRRSVDGKLITVIDVNASDVFGELARLPGEYISRFETYTENHSNLTVDDIELPF